MPKLVGGIQATQESQSRLAQTIASVTVPSTPIAEPADEPSADNAPIASVDHLARIKKYISHKGETLVTDGALGLGLSGAQLSELIALGYVPSVRTYASGKSIKVGYYATLQQWQAIADKLPATPSKTARVSGTSDAYTTSIPTATHNSKIVAFAVKANNQWDMITSTSVITIKETDGVNGGKPRTEYSVLIGDKTVKGWSIAQLLKHCGMTEPVSRDRYERFTTLSDDLFA